MMIAFGILLFGLLAILTWIDIREQRLPDVFTYPLAFLGLLSSYVLTNELVPALIGLVAGYLALVLVETAYRSFRGREGLGRGDAKLFAAGGAWCTFWFLPHILLVASLAGLAFVGGKAILQRKPIDSQDRLPFGPFLALGIGAVWMSSKMAG
jgi:leader peptidase (prepilin peptidase)/N-methyltransferase